MKHGIRTSRPIWTLRPDRPEVWPETDKSGCGGSGELPLGSGSNTENKSSKTKGHYSGGDNNKIWVVVMGHFLGRVMKTRFRTLLMKFSDEFIKSELPRPNFQTGSRAQKSTQTCQDQAH